MQLCSAVKNKLNYIDILWVVDTVRDQDMSVIKIVKVKKIDNLYCHLYELKNSNVDIAGQVT